MDCGAPWNLLLRAMDRSYTEVRAVLGDLPKPQLMQDQKSGSWKLWQSRQKLVYNIEVQ